VPVLFVGLGFSANQHNKPTEFMQSTVSKVLLIYHRSRYWSDATSCKRQPTESSTSTHYINEYYWEDNECATFSEGRRYQ
jgi:hypothetical protein